MSTAMANVTRHSLQMTVKGGTHASRSIAQPNSVVRPTSIRRVKPAYVGRRGIRIHAEASGTAVVEEAPSARKSGLALMLDDGTRKSHSVAENTAFVTGFFKGIAERDSFARLVAGLYFVYEAMEDAFDKSTNESVKALDYKELRRLKSLEEDMAYYFGENWRETVKPTPATQKYVAQIKRVAEEDPVLLIAHQYTRYLGDLFGGQMMGGMATRSLKLEEGKGVAFYTFDDIPDAKEFIEEWYTKLNALDLPQATKEAIVDEGNAVFALNIDIFSELEGNAFQSVFALALDALKDKLGWSTQADMK